jgi:hypothetical protein
MSEEFIINKHLKLTFQQVKNQIRKQTVIWIFKDRLMKWKPFNTCKYLLLNIPDVPLSESVNSIDEAQEYFSNENENRIIDIDPESEFWGHCSNLQSWYENGYDTRLLHSNLSFPLLFRLKIAGDPLAKRVFNEEVAKRLSSGYRNTVLMILNSDFNYLRDLSEEERETLFLNERFPKMRVCVEIPKDEGMCRDN